MMGQKNSNLNVVRLHNTWPMSYRTPTQFFNITSSMHLVLLQYILQKHQPSSWKAIGWAVQERRIIEERWGSTINPIDNVGSSPTSYNTCKVAPLINVGFILNNYVSKMNRKRKHEDCKFTGLTAVVILIENLDEWTIEEKKLRRITMKGFSEGFSSLCIIKQSIFISFITLQFTHSVLT